MKTINIGVDSINTILYNTVHVLYSTVGFSVILGIVGFNMY